MDAENRSDQQENFDQWLDSVLRARSDAEPRMGLEERVLARLASQPQRTFGWWPRLAMASAAVLAIAIAIALLRPSQPQRTMANRPTPALTPATVDSGSLNASSVPPKESIHKRTHSVPSVGRDRSCCGSLRTVARARREEYLPRLASFPAAHPETDQERLLAQLAAQLTVKWQSSEIASVSIDSASTDLSIKELTVQPLETTPASGSPQQ